MATEIEPDDSLESSATSVTEHLSFQERVLANLERAIKKDNDVAIVHAWKPEYEEYEYIELHLPRVRLAQKRSDALEQFRSALQTNDHEAIVKSFDPILNGYPLIQPGEWERLSAAVRFVFSSCFIMIGKGTDEQWLQATLLRSFMNAIRSDNDEDIVFAFDAIEKAGYLIILNITDQEKDSVKRAKLRIEVRRQFREALNNGYLRPITEANDLVLSYDVVLTPEEQEQADLAIRFVYMFNAHEKANEVQVTAEEDRELVSVYHEIEKSPYRQHLQFTDYELERIERTLQRMEETKRVRDALKEGRPRKIFEARESAALLNEKHLSMDEQAQLQLAKRYVQALQAHGSINHPVVVAIYREIAASPYNDRFFFTTQEIPGSSDSALHPGEIRPDGSLLSVSARLIVTVAGIPIYNKQFQRVYLVKQHYLRLRQSQSQRISNSLDDVQRWLLFQKDTLQDLQSLSEADQQKISQQVLNDIVDDFLTKKEINGLPPAQKTRVEQQVHLLYEEFKQRDGFLYQDFLKTNRFTDDEVRDTLAIFARREFLTEDLLNRNQSIDSWLMLQRKKQNLVIEYAGQDTFEEEREQGGKVKRNPLRLLDWFRIQGASE